MALVIEPEVADALSANRPVVALESTIIAHGLPWPDNLALARELEQVVRDAGAAPATIAIVGGRARIGLGADELAAFAERAGADAGPLGHRSGGSGYAIAGRGPAIAKAGAADLAVHMAGSSDAATTVSATAVLAARAGIPVFATGGIGGVHRGDAGDVSHDLYALATARIAVVSAGAKAILDLPRTVELLESLGVLVIGVGTDEFPAFYTRSSGVALDHRVDDVADLAAILRVR